MDVVIYLRRILARWRLIGLVTAIVAIAVAGITFTLPKTYTSSATYFITSKGTNLDTATALAAGNLAQQKIVAYAAVASSDTMAQAVIQDLKLTTSPFDLRQKITATNTFGTALVVVTVNDNTPQRALAIAESIQRNYDSVLSKVDYSAEDGRLNVVASILAPPQLPTSPSSPYILLNLLAGLASGLLLGVAAAATRDLLDSRVSTTGDLENTIGVPVVGTIVDDRNLGASPISSRKPDSTGIEDFRRLRLNVKSLVNRDCRVIAVTSAGSGEGKTTLAANLALALAEGEANVCLVDADLRAPDVAKLFDIAAEAPGLTTLLSEPVALSDVVHDSGPGLAVIPAGPTTSTPSSLLGSSAFIELVARLRESFDFVIIDTSSLSGSSDAVAVASETDATLLVVQRGRTTADNVRGSVSALTKVDARILGAILNRVPDKRTALVLSR